MVNRRLNIYFILIFLSSWAQGQYIDDNKSENGWFEVNYDTACVPFTVTVNKIISTTPAQTVYYKYESTEIFDSQYTYTQPGTYTIEIIIASEPGRKDSKTIVLYEAAKPEFSLYTCKNNKVYIDIEDDYYDRYRINFGDGQSVDINKGADAEHVYAIAGNYTVTVTGLFLGAPNNCGISSKSISTIVSLQSASITTLAANDPTSATIYFNRNPDANYWLEMNNGISFTTIDTLADLSMTLIQDIDLTNNNYCFKIVAFDACDNQTLDSDIVCTVSTNATAENNQNRITWSTSMLASGVNQLFRDNSPVAVHNSNSYIDTIVECNTEYCYQNRIEYSNGINTYFSYSLPSCITAISNDVPSALTDITSSVAGENIEINWLAPDGFLPDKFFLSRSVNGGAFEMQDSITSASYDDQNVNVGKNRYCYEISYRDQCGNSSAASVTCPVLLTQERGMLFSWNEYKGWASGVSEYFVEKLSETGTFLIEESAATGTSFIDVIPLEEQMILYRIRSVSNDPIPLISYSNIVSAVFPARLVFPKAFTPNGDGLNDDFLVSGIFIESFDLKIYNRWGELVFYSGNKETSWNGNYRNGVEAPEGVYAYVVTYADQTGKSFTKTGSVLLLRKK